MIQNICYTVIDYLLVETNIFHLWEIFVVVKNEKQIRLVKVKNLLVGLIQN